MKVAASRLGSLSSEACMEQGAAIPGKCSGIRGLGAKTRGGHGLEESAWRRRGWRRAGQRAGLPQEAGKGLAARHPPLPPHATPDFSQTLPLLNRGPTGGWAWPGDSFFTAPSGSEPCHLDTAGGCAPG